MRANPGVDVEELTAKGEWNAIVGPKTPDFRVAGLESTGANGLRIPAVREPRPVGYVRTYAIASQRIVVSSLKSILDPSLTLILAISAMCCACVNDAPRASRTRVLLSQPYLIDQIHESMGGPRSIERGIKLLDGPRRLLWVTGIRSEVVNAEQLSPDSVEFFCHSNLQFAGSWRQAATNELFTTIPDGRLFTLIPGRLELSLPSGFGLPVYSDETLEYFSMALNLNETTRSHNVKFRTTVVFDDDGAGPEKQPLFRRAVYAHESATSSDAPQQDHQHLGLGQPMGAASHSPVPRSADPDRTVHWRVSPGRSENITDVTSQLGIPETTTVHLATAHLHPYARSVSLRDKVTGEVLITLKSKDYEGRRGVAEMEIWRSAAGVTVFSDREYELLTVYDNRTNGVIDAMSIVYLYFVDRRFVGSRKSRDRTGTRFSSMERIITSGDLTFGKRGLQLDLLARLSSSSGHSSGSEPLVRTLRRP